MSRKFEFVLDHQDSHELTFTIASDGARARTRTAPRCEGYSTEEWICFLFGSDPCWRTMAGKHGDVVSERKYFFPDLGYQQIDISAGQITASNASGEKDIAADE